MTLARTYPQVSQGSWRADIGEINDVLQVFFTYQSHKHPTVAFSIPLSDAATLYDCLNAGTSPTYQVDYHFDPIVIPAGFDAPPALVDTKARYVLHYVGDLGVGIASFPESALSDLTALVLLVRNFDFTTAPPNDWDASVSPSVAQYGVYPGLRYPSGPRAVPGFL